MLVSMSLSPLEKEFSNGFCKGVPFEFYEKVLSSWRKGVQKGPLQELLYGAQFPGFRVFWGFKGFGLGVMVPKTMLSVLFRVCSAGRPRHFHASLPKPTTGAQLTIPQAATSRGHWREEQRADTCRHRHERHMFLAGQSCPSLFDG